MKYTKQFLKMTIFSGNGKRAKTTIGKVDKKGLMLHEILRSYKTKWPSKANTKRQVAATIRGKILVKRLKYNHKLYEKKKELKW